MVVRQIKFTVNGDTVTPTTVQDAGYYGDDKCTQIIFNGTTNSAKYRIEITDGGGAYDITELLTAGTSLAYDIPAAWTAAGVATLRLVEIVIDDDGKTENAVKHYPPVRLSFAHREDGAAMGEMLPTWQSVMTAVEASAKEANEAASDASYAMQYANSAGAAAAAMTAKLEKSADLADEAMETANEALVRAASVKGVYVGTGEMPPEYNVQIDPSGETDVVSVACGGTGATTATKARSKLEVPKSTWLVDNVDIDTLSETGFYLVKNTNISVNKPFGDMEFNIIHIDRTGTSTKIATQIAIRDDVVDPRIKVRKKLSGTWYDWYLITQKAENVHRHNANDFDVVTIASDQLDNARAPGWYYIDRVVAGGTSHYHATMHVNCNNNDGTIVVIQTLYSATTSSVQTLQRAYSYGSWKEWEWENPPLYANTEYRTVERYNGSAVYVKRKSFGYNGTLGDTEGVGLIEIPHEINGLNKIVRCYGRVPGSSNFVFPYLSSSGGITTVVGVDSANISLRIAKMTWSAGTFEFDVYYTK